MTPPVTQGRDAWSVPDIEALRPLAPRRSRWADVLLHRRRLVTAAVAFPLVLWAARTSMPAGLEVGAAWWALLALTATLGSLALATYVPLARTDGTSAGGSRAPRRPSCSSSSSGPPAADPDRPGQSAPTPRLTG